MANVGVMAGADVLVGEKVLVGESVGVEGVIRVIGVGASIVRVTAVGAERSDDSTGAQETNIQVKKIPIINRFCISYVLLSIQRGINGLLKSGIRLSPFNQFSINNECRCALDSRCLCIVGILTHQIGVRT